MSVYLVQETDGGAVKVARVRDLMVADGVEELILILPTEWRLKEGGGGGREGEEEGGDEE